MLSRDIRSGCHTAASVPSSYRQRPGPPRPTVSRGRRHHHTVLLLPIESSRDRPHATRLLRARPPQPHVSPVDQQPTCACGHRHASFRAAMSSCRGKTALPPSLLHYQPIKGTFSHHVRELLLDRSLSCILYLPPPPSNASSHFPRPHRAPTAEHGQTLNRASSEPELRRVHHRCLATGAHRIPLLSHRTNQL